MQTTQFEKWLQRRRTGKPLAVILGSTIGGLSFIRSLDRRNVPVLQLDSDKNEAMYTRYGAGYLLPSLDRSVSEWLEFLEFAGKRIEQPGVIFPTSDRYLLFLSKNRQEIGKRFRFLIPSPEAVEQIVNKRTQYTMAEKAGIAVPPTVYPESEADVRSWAGDLPYPCILKPYTYEGKRIIRKKAVLTDSPAQLIEEYARVSDSGQRFMIQEVIPGGRRAVHSYSGFWDREGRERAWWTKTNLRGTPFGYGSIHVTIDAPKAAALSRRLLAAFDYRGFSHVEFKLDYRDESYRLMEINARTGQANQLGPASGVDSPWIAYRYLSGMSDTADSCPAFQPGVVYMDEKVDMEVWRSGEIGLLTWFTSFVRAHTRAYWTWNDPGPFLALARNVASSSIRAKLVGYRDTLRRLKADPS